MNASDFLVRLDALGLAAAGWIATWWLHSLALCALALAVGRALRPGSLREQLYKVALVGAFVTTGAQAIGVGVGDTLHFELGRSERAGAAIGIVGSAPVPSPAVGSEPRLAHPTAAAAIVPPERPAARWRLAHALALAALLVALLGVVSLLREWLRLRRAMAGRHVLLRTDWNDSLRELARRAGLARLPGLSTSRAFGSPIALARGELVVPERALDELDPEARRALLAHELAHLARRDPQWLALTAGLSRVFAFQPLQLLVRRRLVDELELACDAQAVRWTGSGLPLARCLASVASWIAPRPAPSFVASMAPRESGLVRRVEHALAAAPPPTTYAQRRIFCLGMAMALALLACSGPRIEPAPADPDAKVPNEPSETATAAGHGATLDIEQDGKILAGTQVLFDPAEGSYEELDAYLDGLARGMETQPLNPAYPDGPQLMMGEVVLHAADSAPTYSLLKAMERCGAKNIWRLRFTGDWPGGEEGLAVPLPTDVGLEVSLEDASSAPAAPIVELVLRVLEEGGKIEPVTGKPWTGEPGSKFEYDSSRKLEYSVGPWETGSLEELATDLKSILAQRPDRNLTIDARKGIVYRDVIGVLDVVRAAGFEQVTFVGQYQ